MFPIRTLSKRWHVSPASVFRIRRDDPDYREIMVEFDVGGVTMGDEDREALYIARKRERAEAVKAAAAQPLKRRVGRPRKNQLPPAA